MVLGRYAEDAPDKSHVKAAVCAKKLWYLRMSRFHIRKRKLGLPVLNTAVSSVVGSHETSIFYRR